MEPFLGEIRPMAFGIIPKGWAACNGQLLPIQQNAALFSLLGVQFGGDGKTNFALPDLRGRVPLHMSPQNPVGTQAGSETVTLTLTTLPNHTHSLNCSTANANKGVPGPGNSLAQTASGVTPYAPGASPTPLGGQSVGNTGGSQPHENMQPYQVINFCIALTGIYPSHP